MTFAVYSLRISADLPVQSKYMPKISWYFITSIAFNLSVMFWYVYRNRCITTSEIPKFLDTFCEYLKKMFCLCFTPAKKPTKDNDKSKAVEGGEEKSKIENETKKKDKCQFCDRCKDCEAGFKKEEEKGKKKKEIESKLDALNYLIFIIVLVAMFITQMSIWLTVSTA